MRSVLISKVFYIIIVSSLFVSTTNVSAVTTQRGIITGWINGSGESCFKVCNDTGGKPVISGSTGDNSFYICRANPGDYGNRAGFNQEPNNSNICYVAFGQNKAVRASTYSCLCFK